MSHPAKRKTPVKKKIEPVSPLSGYPIYHYMIVENNPSDVDQIELVMLKYFKHITHLATCTTYEEAIVRMPELKPDLVFMDVRLNAGYTCFDVYANIPPDNYRAIYVTASDSYIHEATNHNLVKYLIKPLDTERLIDAVNRAHFVEFKALTQHRVEQRYMQNYFELQRKITVNKGDSHVLIPLNEVIAFKTAIGNTNKKRFTYVVLQHEDINQTEFEHTTVQKNQVFDYHQLPPCFISGQSHILNVTQIEELRPRKKIVFENKCVFDAPESLYKIICTYLGLK